MLMQEPKREITQCRARLLVVDDELSNLQAVQRILEQEAFEVITCRSGAEALSQFQKRPVDAVLSDLRMPGMSGLDLLRAVRRLDAKLPVLLLTAFGTVDDAVEAMKLGAVDFLRKPISGAALLRAVQDCLARAGSSPRAAASLRMEDCLQGQSPGIMELRRTIRMLAPTSAAVLIQGESGTGKEVVAQLIHRESGRTGKIVSVNCGAIPESLLESELFGHEKGAFTGASAAKPGLFELAHEGTIFLDEIGEMPASLQVKLLRVLQDGVIHRLGSTQPRQVDARVIAATNANLRDRIAAGTFREDLFYRLNVVSLVLEPLHTRGEDILLLANSFLQEAATRYNRSGLVFSEPAQKVLLHHKWPGNIRELKNSVEKAVVMGSGSEITPRDLGLEKAGGAVVAAANNSQELRFAIGTSLRDVESEVIRRTLEAMGGDKALAAKVLGVNVRTIYRKIESGL